MINLTDRQKKMFCEMMRRIEDIADLGYKY